MEDLEGISHDKEAIKEAIDSIVNNFSKHANVHGHGKSKLLYSCSSFVFI